MMKPQNAALSVSYLTSAGPYLLFISTNDGAKPGALDEGVLNIEWHPHPLVHRSMELKLVPRTVDNRPFWIEPGATIEVDFCVEIGGSFIQTHEGPMDSKEGSYRNKYDWSIIDFHDIYQDNGPMKCSSSLKSASMTKSPEVLSENFSCHRLEKLLQEIARKNSERFGPYGGRSPTYEEGQFLLNEKTCDVAERELQGHPHLSSRTKP